jgi:hypothetical protein
MSNTFVPDRWTKAIAGLVRVCASAFVEKTGNTITPNVNVRRAASNRARNQFGSNALSIRSIFLAVIGRAKRVRSLDLVWCPVDVNRTCQTQCAGISRSVLRLE